MSLHEDIEKTEKKLAELNRLKVLGDKLNRLNVGLTGQVHWQTLFPETPGSEYIHLLVTKCGSIYDRMWINYKQIDNYIDLLQKAKANWEKENEPV